jgi:hypothetical protein
MATPTSGAGPAHDSPLHAADIFTRQADVRAWGGATDLSDVLTETIRDLAHARYERHVYRAWFGAALDKLHEQQRTIDRHRVEAIHLRDQIRQLMAVDQDEAA